MSLVRSKVSQWMWYHEWNRWAFVIDLQSWALPVRVSDHGVQILCFSLDRL